MSDPEGPLVEVSRDDEGSFDLLTLRRVEKANALDFALVRALASAMRQVEDRTACAGEATTIVLRSAHRAFSAGFDLGDVEGHSEGDILLRFVELERLFQRLRRGPTPSVAVVEGAAYGAGADLAVACTWRVGTAKAKFRFPGFRFGVALGTRHLSSVVGGQTARRILLENRLVGAEEAHALGLLTHLVEPDEIEATVRVLAKATGDLPEHAGARILGMTAPATEDADLADLVRSLTEGDLRAKIARYVAARDTAGKGGGRAGNGGAETRR